MKLIYQGFDAFYVSFQGIFPEYIRYQLEQGKLKAQDTRKETLVYLGEKEIPVLVEPFGARGYQFIFSTGIDREKWLIADNNKSDRWNIFIQVRSLSLALHGYKAVKRNILKLLKDIEAQGALEDFSLLERVSRFDYCFDFISSDFAINPKCISAHSNTKRQFIGGNRLISQNKDIETVMIGKLPNRQIVFYDKTKEIIAHNNKHWLDIWGLSKDDIKNKKIWRVEIRAGKEELNSWNLKQFNDFEEKAADVLLNIANSIRYIKPNYKDSNKARWKNKEFWDDLISAIKNDLFEFSSNAERVKLITGFKNKKISEYQKLFLNLIPPFMALKEISYDELADALNELDGFIVEQFYSEPDIFEAKINEAKDRFIFLE